MARPTSAVALLALLPALCSAFYSGDSAVRQLDSSTIASVPGEGLWLVEFYAPWCGHCKSLAPAWEEVAAALKGVLQVGAVDADAHKELAAEFGIKGFPTIKLLHAGKKGGKRKAVEYKGGRSAKEILEWALGQAKKVALARIGASPSPEGRKRAPPPPTGNGFYGAGSDVISLTDASFHSQVAGEELWLVEFYAPWSAPTPRQRC